MIDLEDLIDKWTNSALNFREAETIINLLIVDNKRLEKENKRSKGWHDVVINCEKLFKCDDGTAKSPIMSNLPNLIRDCICTRSLDKSYTE